MYAVGRLGSYISSPFHPFGGAVDIIVVEQPDGSLKSSPWYVRFGKFQGVLKVKEKVVKINVNGVEADYHMYLDHKGEAFFLREIDDDDGVDDVDDEELDSVFYPSSSGEDTDGGQFSDRRRMKSKSCNFDAAALSGSLPPIDATNGKVLTMTNSRSSRILGLVFGRRSMEESSSTQKKEEEEDGGAADSLERAEVAADLLEVKWSTNVASNQHKKDNVSNVSGDDESGTNVSSAQSPIDLKTINCMEYTVMHEERGYNSETRTTSKFHMQKLESSGSDFGVEMSCFNTKHADEASNVGGTCSRENSDCLAASEAAELALANAGCDETTKVLLSEITISGVKSSDYPGNKLYQEQEFQDKVTQCNGICNEVSGRDTVEALVCGDTSESRRIQLDDFCYKVEESSSHSSCGSATEVCIRAKILNETAELTSEVTSVEETSLLVTKEELDISTVAGQGICAGEEAASSLFGDTQSYAQKVTASSVIGSVQDVESCSISSISGFQNSIPEQEVENMMDQDHISMIHGSSETLADCQDSRNDSSPRKLITVSSLEVSDEEQLLFGDLDELSDGDAKSSCLRHETKEPCSSITSEDNEAVYHTVESSPRKLVAENPQNEIEGSEKHSRIISGQINIPRSRNISGADDVGRMAESLPNILYANHDFVSDDFHSLSHSLDTNSPSAKRNPPAEDLLSGRELDPDKEVKIKQSTVDDTEVDEELRQLPANLEAGDESVINASSGNWKVWPFSFRRSRSIKKSLPSRTSTISSNDDSDVGSSTDKNGKKDVTKPQVKKKKLRAITPTPQQLASLNLDEGKNIITFTFSTSMLGQQQVDARIYLWKWDSRVVISDVDGTITKSDVLGQFMPMVGVDWSHTGVTHLFSAIKENGYQLLFLSARSISQAYLTRQFLLNLKQDGKALPDGPVVISPDGLFPSLFREVIRRAPHEFKIACLEDIKAIFPPDRNPFYAGFGNRDTDELSYLKVGIPIGKIFIINSKGEVVVNRTVDSKSYTSLHDLVHDIFPPTCSSEQEDFNDLNFWKLPPSSIDV